MKTAVESGKYNDEAKARECPAQGTSYQAAGKL